MTGYETASTTLGGINAGINAGSWIGDLAYGARDREYAKWLNDEQLRRYDEMIAYQKEQDAIAQANFESQMAFQQQQFEANRIGNLTKEYAEAGLNPYLAAGMGASTASVVGGGASAGHATGTPNTKPISHYQIQSKNDILGGLSQLMMQEQLNEAEVKKLEADAKLANTQADDLTNTREARIAEIQARTNLSEKEAERVVVATNAICADINLTAEKIKNTQADTLAKEIANEINKKFGAQLKETEIKKIEEEITKSKHDRRIETAEEVRKWFDGLLDKLVRGGQVAVNSMFLK